jgi:hypothetical protein
MPDLSEWGVKTPKAKKKTTRNSRTELTQIRVPLESKARWQRVADKLTRGNLSRWIIEACDKAADQAALDYMKFRGVELDEIDQAAEKKSKDQD